MAIFLRGNVWWFEYRTRKVRVVKSTGFRKGEKAKAQAVFDAFRLGMVAKPPKSAMEKMLAAIYGGGGAAHGIPLGSVWALYEDWFKGKAKSVAAATWRNRSSVVAHFVEWADSDRGLADVGDVSVEVARQYVKRLVASGKSNKTVRNLVLDLSHVWNAIGQLRPDVHNPWRAACPDKDGSANVGEAFTQEEEERVLAAARRVGHGWYEASMIARFTGQRYGDVATLEWSQVDFDAGLVRFRPSKTKRAGFSVAVPMHDRLREVLQGLHRRGSVGFVLPEHGVVYGIRRELQEPFSSVLREAGLDPDRFTFHSWRHTFRTRLGEAGVPDEVAARFGWTNLAMSRHYDHAAHEAEMRDAVGRLA